MEQLETEVLIIGGGVLGAAAARELSRYQVNVTLVEKAPDFGWGSTKANMGVVCQGGDTLEFRPEYQRSKLVWDSMPLMEPLCRELEIPFKRIGELALIRNNSELGKYRKQQALAEKNGIAGHRLIDQTTLRQMEPHVTRDVIGALYDPNIAVIDPVRLTLALVENAAQNGVSVRREVAVQEISRKPNRFEVRTTGGVIHCRYVVNAAGTSADKIARMVNADDFVLYPVRGYVAILDKELAGLVTHEVHARPEVPGQMNIVTPSVHGNLFFGSTMQLAPRGDLSTTQKMADLTLNNVRKIVPDISGKDIIRSFAGFLMVRNWEMGWHECVVRASGRIPRWINVCMGYPGVSAAPATGRKVVELLRQEGLALKENSGFSPYRVAAPVFSELSEEQQGAWIARDSRYGHMVCRCETVSEGEMVEAIRRGATTMDGIKFRTRAGMGRCQGGFCSSRVQKILARELCLPEEQITKQGRNSHFCFCTTRE